METPSSAGRDLALSRRLHPRVCRHCAAEFEGWRWAIYCSRNCRMKSYYQRQKLAREEAKKRMPIYAGPQISIAALVAQGEPIKPSDLIRHLGANAGDILTILTRHPNEAFTVRQGISYHNRVHGSRIQVQKRGNDLLLTRLATVSSP